MVKKFTSEGKSCEDYVERFNDHMNKLKENYSELVKSIKIVYDCKFSEFLDGDYSPDFDSSFLQNDLFKEKKYFQQLVPRDSCLPGKKALFHLNWNKNDHPSETFHYWDMNMAYTYALKKFR